MSSGSGSSTDKNLGDNNNKTTDKNQGDINKKQQQENAPDTNQPEITTILDKQPTDSARIDNIVEELVNSGLASRELVELVIDVFVPKNSTPDTIANFILEHPEIVEDLNEQQQSGNQPVIANSRMGSILSSSTSNQTSSSNHGNLVSRATSLIPNTFGLAFGALGETAHKMVFVVNMDLDMGKGKQCAQVAHAALGLYLKIQQTGSDQDQYKAYQWLYQGQKKIVLKGNNLQHMKKIQADADAARLPNFMVSDAGCTQIAPGSKTVLSIFGVNEDVDKVTGDLRLL